MLAVESYEIKFGVARAELVDRESRPESGLHDRSAPLVFEFSASSPSPPGQWPERGTLQETLATRHQSPPYTPPAPPSGGSIAVPATPPLPNPLIHFSSEPSRANQRPAAHPPPANLALPSLHSTPSDPTPQARLSSFVSSTQDTPVPALISVPQAGGGARGRRSESVRLWTARRAATKAVEGQAGRPGRPRPGFEGGARRVGADGRRKGGVGAPTTGGRRRGSHDAGVSRLVETRPVLHAVRSVVLAAHRDGGEADRPIRLTEPVAVGEGLKLCRASHSSDVGLLRTVSTRTR